MPVFVELTTNLFSQVFKDNQSEFGRARRAGTQSARRPLRGMEIKDDTYALLRVVDLAGKPLHLFDSSRKTSVENDEGTYTNFILQSVQEARMEKNQIVDTFGDSYIFFFGESPRFIDVSVVLLNSNDFNWEAEWWANYENYFRGSRLTEYGARLYMFYDDNIVEGYMLSCQSVKTSAEPLMVTMQFRMFVTNYSNVTLVGDTDFPIRGSVDLPEGVSLDNASATQSLTDLLLTESALRGANDAAGFALKQNAFSRFGGMSLITQSLRRGFDTSAAGVAQAAFVTAGALGASPVAALLAAGLAGAAAGPPAAGTGAAQDLADVTANPDGFVQAAGVALGVASMAFGKVNDGDTVRTLSIDKNGFHTSKTTTKVAHLPQRTEPLRSSIFDNADEWTGPEDFRVPMDDPDNTNSVADLPLSTLLALGAYGVHAISAATASSPAEPVGPSVMNGLGIGPKFTPGGVGLGSGSSSSQSASWGSGRGGLTTNPQSASPGYSQGGVGTGIGLDGPYPQAYSPTSQNSGTTTTPKAPYANYPGYGQGHGSALGGPGGGYSPGSLGVGTSSNVGIGSSYGGGTGVGVVAQVGGIPSAFAMESFPGELDPTGTSYIRPDGSVDSNKHSQQAGKAVVNPRATESF